MGLNSQAFIFPVSSAKITIYSDLFHSTKMYNTFTIHLLSSQTGMSSKHNTKRPKTPTQPPDRRRSTSREPDRRRSTSRGRVEEGEEGDHRRNMRLEIDMDRNTIYIDNSEQDKDYEDNDDSENESGRYDTWKATFAANNIGDMIRAIEELDSPGDKLEQLVEEYRLYNDDDSENENDNDNDDDKEEGDSDFDDDTSENDNDNAE